MSEIWALAALWLGLALVATLVSIWLRVATALSEIVVGTIAQLLPRHLLKDVPETAAQTPEHEGTTAAIVDTKREARP